MNALGYAQTNLQLWLQMRAQYSLDELALLARCYETAMQLFSGQYRPSGKPFVAHLVGTASILAADAAPAPLVAAGMLHASYEYGDFGSAEMSLRRAMLRGGSTDEIETLVHDYWRTPWNEETMRRLDALPTSVRWLRLANELEDLLDAAMLFVLDTAWLENFRERHVDALAQAAAALGAPRLASALRQAVAEASAGSPVPSCLRLSHRPSVTFTLMPTSARELQELLAERLGTP